jgi:hypothetical protein
MDDTWTSRDLPVLKAVVEIYDTTGKTVISPGEIAAKAGFDQETTERAIRALYRQPYLEPGHISWSGHTDAVGPPTGEALRVAGQWPTAENMLERLIAALEAAGDDETVAEPERSKLKQIALGLRGAAYQVTSSCGRQRPGSHGWTRDLYPAKKKRRVRSNT